MRIQRDKGITLIALIITIVILLILAVVAIKAVQENGIIMHANTARDKTKIAQVREELNLWDMNNKLIEINGGTKQTLAEFLDTLDLTDEQKNQIINTGYLTIGDYTEKVIEIGISPKLKLGQYVEYETAGKGVTYIDSTSSGSTNSSSTIINVTRTLVWQIMSINSDSTISLLGIGTTDSIELAGVRGYNNGVKILNSVCSELYSNSNYGATARSINIEDIQNLSGYDYRSYTLNGIKYGDTASVSSSEYVPLRYFEFRSNNSTDGDSYYTGEAYIHNELDITQTYWTANNIDPTEMGADTIGFFAAPGNNFWIASRYEDITNSTNFDFGIRSKEGSDTIKGVSMFKTDGTAGEGASLQYLPVVTIPGNRINPDADVNAGKNGEKNSAWVLS